MSKDQAEELARFNETILHRSSARKRGSAGFSKSKRGANPTYAHSTLTKCPFPSSVSRFMSAIVLRHPRNRYYLHTKQAKIVEKIGKYIVSGCFYQLRLFRSQIDLANNLPRLMLLSYYFDIKFVEDYPISFGVI